MGLDIKEWSGDNSYFLSIIAFIGMVFIVPNGMNLREQRLISFEILALVILSYLVFRHNKSLGIFFGYVSCSIPFHEAIDINVMFAIMAYAVLYLFATNVGKPDRLYNVICVSAILCALWQVLQHFGVWVMMAPYTDNAYVGLLSNTNETSAFLGVSSICFFRRRWIWSLPIPLLGLYLGVSIGGVVAAYLAGLIFIVMNIKKIEWKKLLLFFIALTLFLALCVNHKAPKNVENKFGVMAQTQIDSRLRYWIDMAPIANMKPFGWGLGQFKYVMPLIQTPTHLKPEHRVALWQNIGDKKSFDKAIELASKGDVDSLLKKRWDVIWLEAHNEYMEIWFASGIVGLLLALYAILRTLMMPSPLIPKYGFLIACISAIWFFSFQIAPIAIITILYMGVVHAQNNS